MRKIVLAIPTLNEEKHILRAIEYAKRITKTIYVFDSGSIDKTEQLVRENNIPFKKLPKEFSFAEKMNYIYQYEAFRNCLVFRMDADEIITNKNRDIIIETLKNSNSDLYILTRKLSFMGKKLSFGRTALPSLRIALCGSIIYEKVDLDERIIPIKNEDKIKKINAYIIDKPNISFFEWINKHNKYSDLESLMFFKTANKRKLNKPLFVKVYYYLPPIIRPFLFFVFRYIFCLGFLDGIKGLLFQVSHTIIYRLLVDIKILLLILNKRDK